MFLVPVPWTSLFLDWITLKFTSLFLIFSIPLYVLGFQTVGQIHRVLDVRRFLSWWDSYSLPMIVAEFFKSDTSPLMSSRFFSSSTGSAMPLLMAISWSTLNIPGALFHPLDIGSTAPVLSLLLHFSSSSRSASKPSSILTSFFSFLSWLHCFRCPFGWPISLRNSCNQSGPRLWWFLDYSFPR